MHTYQITSTRDGRDLGRYEADDERGALDCMALLSGYRDADAAAAAIGGPLDWCKVERTDAGDLDRAAMLDVDGVDGDTFAITVGDLLDANSEDEEMIAVIRDAKRDGSAIGGGGAAPEYTVRWIG